MPGTSGSRPDPRPTAGSIVGRSSFAALLRRHRRAAGLTQEELAERAGISVNAVSALERGVNTAPRRDTVALLAEALGLADPERVALEAAARGRAVGPAVRAPNASGAAPASMRSTPVEIVPGQRLPPLVGRVRERDLLQRYLDPIAAPGAPVPLLLFRGEPGIGKSRLLAEAAHAASDMGWAALAGRCYRRSAQEPFAPLLAALDDWIRAAPRPLLRDAVADCAWLARLLPELAEAGLITPPRWTLPVEQERRLMFAAVRRFLAQAAGPAGTLLVLDDLQWAGADGLDLLASLLRSSDGESPLRVVGAYRDTELDREGPLALVLADLAREGLVAQRSLGRLDADESSALMRELLGAEADGADGADGVGRRRAAGDPAGDPAGEREPDERGDPEAARAVELAAGVPFFLVSFAQTLRLGALAAASAGRSAGAPRAEGGEPSVVAGIPWELAQTIRARIAVLPPFGTQLLGVAAISGRDVRRDVLLCATRALPEPSRSTEPTGADASSDGLLDALDAACRAGLLVESGEGAYVFGHELIREVVVADLSAARRELLHRHVAEALERIEGETPVDRLAFHYARSGTADRAAAEKAVDYLGRAADRAAAAHAFSVAADTYRELVARLDTAGRPVEAARARERLGLALRSLGRNDEALACFERAHDVYRERGDLERTAWAVAQIGWAQVARGEAQAGYERLRASLRVFEEFEYPYGVALVRTALADLHYAAGDYRWQLFEAERAAALAQSLGDERLLAQAAQLRGRALLALGPLDEGLAVMREAVRHSRACDDVTNLCLALCMASLGYWLQGRFDAQLECAEQAVDAAAQVGDPPLLALAHPAVSLVAWGRGEWAAARDRLEAAEAAVRHADATLVVPYVQAVLGVIELATGAGGPQGGSARLERAAAAASAIGDLVPQRFAQAGLAEADILAGRPARARERLLPLLDRAGLREPFAVPLLALGGWAELEMGELGEFGRAWTRCEVAVGRARAEGMRLVLVDALRAQALVAVRFERWDEAERSLQEALALACEMPYPYGEAKALVASGQLAAARGEPETARARYTAALVICARLGERLYADHAETLLAALR